MFRAPCDPFKISAFLLVLDNLETEVYRFPGVFGGTTRSGQVIYYCRSAPSHNHITWKDFVRGGSHNYAGRILATLSTVP